MLNDITAHDLYVAAAFISLGAGRFRDFLDLDPSAPDERILKMAECAHECARALEDPGGYANSLDEQTKKKTDKE